MNNSPQLKVGFCAYDWPHNVSGPASWLGRLLPELPSLGIDPFCIVLSWEQSGPLVELLIKHNIPYVQHPCQPTSEERTEWILEQLAEHPVDVFVPNHLVPAFYASKWVRSAYIPTIGILHSDDDFYQAVQAQFVHRQSAFSLSSIVCVSEQLRTQVCSRPSHKCEVIQIPYGVPIPQFTAKYNTSHFRIAYVGRLAEEQKRISEVTTAFCRVTSQISNTEAVLFGEGPDKAKVETILKSKANCGAVQLIGRIDPDRIQEELQKCHAIVLLSDYEGLPISIIEAMACGVVPICLSMRSGIDELLADGCGIIVQDREKEFDDAIKRLVNSADEWQQLSNSARTKVRQEYSVENNARQWAEMLHKASANSAAKTKKLKWPRRLSLPKTHSAFLNQDPRAHRSPVLVKLYYRLRMLAGRARRLAASAFKNGN